MIQMSFQIYNLVKLLYSGSLKIRTPKNPEKMRQKNPLNFVISPLV